MPIALTPLGFMLSAYLAITMFPNSQGSGIPQAIAARHLMESERALLLSPRIAFGKIVLTVLGLFSGASIGREGPVVQVGASIMLTAARFGDLPQARGPFWPALRQGLLPHSTRHSPESCLRSRK
ncbi:H+/Cl- antiporter ClcA [Sinorhizobium fredii]|nr:Chloride channel protein [Sinorhizobium fredii CCBAU 25509]